MRNKEEVVSSIATRILDEHRKHKALGKEDWVRIAASKIYSAHLQPVEDLLQVYYDSVKK